MKNKTNFSPDKIGSYFRVELKPLVFVTLSGLVYNFGLLASPWFEGKLAQCLADILGGKTTANKMTVLVLAYIAVILGVQAARFVKRFYVRRFGNNINRRMKGVLYANLVRQSRAELNKEGGGELLTKAISDVDDCAEGIRKFTTEVFDTGVALVGYIAMLLAYDYRLALLCLIFPPVSYICAELMKKPVQRAGSAYKKAAAALNGETLDRAQNAVTYRVYGCEETQERRYEKALGTYEKTAVKANVWQSALPPLYLAVSNLSVIFILWFGSKNVLGSGWQQWDVAAFTTFLSCYAKLSEKSSKAAKLFNAVQKAEVSWKRIKPLMKTPQELSPLMIPETSEVTISNLSFSYGDDSPVFSGLDITAKPGDIIGITGAVACGKSTLGRTFLCEMPYEGSIKIGGCELSQLTPREISATVGYLGHDPELWSDTVRNNVLCGDSKDAKTYLKEVCLDEEVEKTEQGENTLIGSGGVRLSGGQAQRLALARTLAHPRPVLVLDDPISALDRKTEDVIFANLKEYAQDKVLFIISHRLYHFPEMTKIIFMENKKVQVGTHKELLRNAAAYRTLYESQTGGNEDEE